MFNSNYVTNSKDSEVENEKNLNDIYLNLKTGTDIDIQVKNKLEEMQKDKKSSRDEKNHNHAIQLAKTAESENEWNDVYLNAIYNSELEILAKQKLTDCGYFKRREDIKTTKHVIAVELAKTAETEDEWHKIWLDSKSDSEVSSIAKEKIDNFRKQRNEARKEENHNQATQLSKTAETEDEWHIVYVNAILNSELDILSKQKLTEFGYFKRKEDEKEAKHILASSEAISLL